MIAPIVALIVHVLPRVRLIAPLAVLSLVLDSSAANRRAALCLYLRGCHRQIVNRPAAAAPAVGCQLQKHRVVSCAVNAVSRRCQSCHLAVAQRLGVSPC